MVLGLLFCFHWQEAMVNLIGEVTIEQMHTYIFKQIRAFPGLQNIISSIRALKCYTLITFAITKTTKYQKESTPNVNLKYRVHESQLEQCNLCQFSTKYKLHACQPLDKRIGGNVLCTSMVNRCVI